MRDPGRFRFSTWVAALVGVATVIAYFVGIDRSLDYDSSVTVGNFIGTVELWAPLRHQIVFNNHPLFSLVEHVVWLAGGDSEVALLVLPVLCGAAGAALVAGWVAAVAGRLPGLTAGALLAANPVYAQLSRSVRGYSLMAMAVIAATLLLVEHTRQPGRRWPAVAYVVLMAVAIGTHVYGGLALLAHAAWLAARRDLTRAWVVRLLWAGVLGAAPYTAMAADMVRDARGRPRQFHEDFALDTARMVLGEHPVAVAALAPLVAWAIWHNRRSMGGRAVALVLTVSLGAVWLVLRPADLYPRFLLPLVAAAAGGIAVGLAHVRRMPAVVGSGLVVVALGAMVSRNTDHWTQDPAPFKQAAGIAHAAVDDWLRPCAALFYGEAFAGYGVMPLPAETAADLARCDVLFVVDGTAEELARAAAGYPHTRTLRGGDSITVYSRSRTILDAPPATIVR